MFLLQDQYLGARLAEFCAVKASLIRGKLIRAGWRVSPTRNFILEDTGATFSTVWSVEDFTLYRTSYLAASAPTQLGTWLVLGLH